MILKQLLGLHPTQQPPADGKNCFIFCRNSKEPLRFRAIVCYKKEFQIEALLYFRAII